MLQQTTFLQKIDEVCSLGGMYTSTGNSISCTVQGNAHGISITTEDNEEIHIYLQYTEGKLQLLVWGEAAYDDQGMPTKVVVARNYQQFCDRIRDESRIKSDY